MHDGVAAVERVPEATDGGSHPMYADGDQEQIAIRRQVFQRRGRGDALMQQVELGQVGLVDAVGVDVGHQLGVFRVDQGVEPAGCDDVGQRSPPTSGTDDSDLVSKGFAHGCSGASMP